VDIDKLELAFDPESLRVLEIILGLVMFGVALNLRVEDFVRILRRPRAPLVGVLAQFVLLPGVTFGATLLLDVPASIALGMIMVAACPGGNVSNFITHYGRGDTATSVSMTAISTTAAIVMMPLNFELWGGLHPTGSALLSEIALSPWTMLRGVFILLGVPLVTGMLVARFFPRVAKKLERPFSILSLAFFAVFVIVAFINNRHVFLEAIGYVLVPVFVMNALALSVGYGMAKLARLSVPECRAVSVEVGIQNSGLALVLIFAFFGGRGGLAAVAAWWGIWHILAGLTVATVWRRRDRARA
jgi:BASS family bile acid:Na+ symporter